MATVTTNTASPITYDIPAEPVGDRIRAARQAAGLSQKQLAAMIGVDRSDVIRWEKNRVKPKQAYRLKIAGATGVPLAQLRHDGRGGTT